MRAVSASARLPPLARQLKLLLPPYPKNVTVQTWSELDAYVRLVQRCWAQLPQDRPTFKEVITDLRCEMLYVGFTVVDSGIVPGWVCGCFPGVSASRRPLQTCGA